MIEGSIAIVLLAFGYFFYRSADRESKLSHIQWVVIGIRARRDFMQKAGRNEDAERLTLVADEISLAIGRYSDKTPSDSATKRRYCEALLLASSDDFLSKLGLFAGSVAFLPTKNALMWLANKHS